MLNSPLEVSYNRLDEAHRAWHLALNGYHKIEDFRAGVNSTIQSLRNLTFALQSAKSNLAGFDIWYEAWREKMKNDPILKELHGARNVIVKQEDLKLKSTAVAKVKGWENYTALSFEFNPLSDSHSVAKGFYDSYVTHLPLSEEDKERLLFDFERKWVYEKLPEIELLAAVAYSYHFLWKVLKEAEVKFSLAKDPNSSSGDFCPSKLTEGGYLKCMIVTREQRSLFFSLKNNAIYTGEISNFSPTKEWKDKAEERYGAYRNFQDILLIIENISTTEYPFKEIKRITQVALANIKRDKYLVPMSFIFIDKDKPPIGISHTFRNQTEKLLAINRVADEIIRIKGTSVLQLGEAWIAPFKQDGHDYPMYIRKDKRDGVLIQWVSGAKGRVFTIPFRRNLFGKIVFSKMEIEDFDPSSKHKNYILLPIIEALKKVSG